MKLIQVKKAYEKGTLPIALNTAYKWSSLKKYPKLLLALLDNRQREPQKKAKDKKGNKRKPKFTNEHCLIATYGVLEKIYYIPRSSIKRAFNKLIKKGFIEISHQGGTCDHDKSTYKLLDDYLYWNPKTKKLPFQVKEPKPDSIHRGYQGKKLGATEKR
jgi:hypothetical protein